MKRHGRWGTSGVSTVPPRRGRGYRSLRPPASATSALGRRPRARRGGDCDRAAAERRRSLAGRARRRSRAVRRRRSGGDRCGVVVRSSQCSCEESSSTVARATATRTIDGTERAGARPRGSANGVYHSLRRRSLWRRGRRDHRSRDRWSVKRSTTEARPEGRTTTLPAGTTGASAGVTANDATRDPAPRPARLDRDGGRRQCAAQQSESLGAGRCGMAGRARRRGDGAQRRRRTTRRRTSRPPTPASATQAPARERLIAFILSIDDDRGTVVTRPAVDRAARSTSRNAFASFHAGLGVSQPARGTYGEASRRSSLWM